jgi:phosphoenolpyruvate carboxykinase (ATP)
MPHTQQDMLKMSKKIQDAIKVWLIIQDGPGPYGTGNRMKLKYTRYDYAALNGALDV